MTVIPFPPRLRAIAQSSTSERYDAARQQMLASFLEWLRADPQAAGHGVEEALATASAMQQLTQLEQAGADRPPEQSA